jgi:hypothetical protein
MTKIDPRLIERLKKRMGAAERTVYSAIQKTATANRVSRDLAALLLAGENGLSYQSYASAEQMAALRGAPVHVPQAEPKSSATPRVGLAPLRDPWLRSTTIRFS